MAYSPSLEQLEADMQHYATAKQNVKEESDDCRMHRVASHATEDFMQLTGHLHGVFAATCVQEPWLS